MAKKQFTASVWILTNAKPVKMLLINHKKTGQWQQPGGHVEDNENPVETAVREVKEETGIDISFLLGKIEKIDNVSSFLPSPDFIMEQAIPEYKNEVMHYHIDFEYVVRVSEQELNPLESESQELGWFTKDEISKLSTHGDTKVIVDKLM